MSRSAIVALLAVAACSVFAPDNRVTLRVENTTCNAACRPIRIFAFPHRQPSTPGEPWTVEIGVLGERFGCFVIPRRARFSVGATDGSSGNVYTWTLHDAASLGFAEHDDVPVANTAEFIAARADGWAVRLPGGREVTETDACT
jgi:hypothetical protein